MGLPSRNYPFRSVAWFCLLYAVWLAGCCFVQAQAVAGAAQALTTPLQRPAGLVFDRAGNLYLAQQSGNTVLRVTPAGLVSVFAGNGTQGFSGDSGPASAAQLDAPAGLALDVTENLYLADEHNHRIRKVDAATGIISSVVTGVQPGGLAIDAAGNLLYTDSLQHRVHRFNLTTNTDQVLAGTGVQGSGGNGSSALAATLDAPFAIAAASNGSVLFTDPHTGMLRAVDASGTVMQQAALPGLEGLALDPAGQIYLADPVHQQIVRLTASGAVQTIQMIAGSGTQGFSGDGGPAGAAALDAPSWLAFSPAGLLTFSDQGNNRVRQIDAQGIIHTIVGVGSAGAVQLTLSGPSVVLYGTGSVTATLQSSPASGAVTLQESADGTAQTPYGSQPLSNNAASFSVAALPAGLHRLQAVYAGDATHASAVSAVLPLTISPALLTVTPASSTLLYGQPVPVLTGAMQGILPQDAASVTVAYSSRAQSLSAPGTYAISVSATGAAAGNYTLSVQPASVTITKAPALVALTSPGPGQLQAHVATTTSGQPQGSVTVLDGTTAIGTGVLDSSGNFTLAATTLSTGSHALTASYAGDGNFLAGTSNPLLLTVAPPTQPDFTLAVSGPSTVNVPAGSAAQFAFTTSPVNGALSSQIQLAASGLPAGATASFNPAYLPPGGAVTAFVLTVQTPHAALRAQPPPYWFAALFPLLLLTRRRQLRKVILVLLLAAIPVVLLGCGDRVNNFFAGEAMRSYTITVTATATQPSGAVIQHAATVTLQVQ